MAGMEILEYMLLTWSCRCAYCLQKASRWGVDQSVPRSQGGSEWLSNLASACRYCNRRKGNQTAERSGHPGIQAQAKTSSRSTAPCWRTARRQSSRPSDRVYVRLAEYYHDEAEKFRIETHGDNTAHEGCRCRGSGSH